MGTCYFLTKPTSPIARRIRRPQMANHPFIVTGAASGIGEATAQKLIANGREVISLDIKTPSADVSARDAEGWTAAMVAAFRNPANVRLQAVLIDRAASS